jgi:signal transduction histidine kinase/CheY-like chemotaxis protein
MTAFRRRLQSIDYKLPVLASGLVVLTSLLLSVTAYIIQERTLLDAAGHQLYNSAAIVAQMLARPSTQSASATAGIDSVLRRFIAGKATREEALAALARGNTPNDTLKIYAAITAPDGAPILEHRRGNAAAPHWPRQAIAAGVAGDTISVGPFENLGVPALATIRPLRASDAPGAELLGYVVAARGFAARNVAGLRSLVGRNVDIRVGQRGAGVWVDLERIVETPAESLLRDSITIAGDAISAHTAIQGTNFSVWVSQSRAAVLAPARALIWAIIPFGIAIALAGAAITWRITRGITRRIVQLTDAAENVATDNGASPMQPTVLLPPTADEVARLRYAFERMARRVSERQTLELRLRHAGKMEAVGRLAGGVAHDFNNLLTAIRSYADLLIADTPEWDAKRVDLIEIRKASERAAALTSQLLAFSRKQMLQPRVLDTAAVLADLKTMLDRILSEDTRLHLELHEALWPVKVDRGQLEQVIVNLSVNARDAMPGGGVIRLAARNLVLGHPLTTRHGEVPQGEYVVISVMDTGVGMDAKTQSQVFEPFFTTKPVGQGTGLGLATVHGIVAQSGGHVTVESQPGVGTTFRVYLPQVQEAPRRSTPMSVAAIAAARRSGSETILMVEDEATVRALARRVLERSGFRVLEADTPGAAIDHARDRGGEIDLVLSDVVMPEMSGPQLVSVILPLCPRARVLFISGYTDDEIIGRGLSDPDMMLLAKPFSAQELVDRVRQALDQQREPAPA